MRSMERKGKAICLSILLLLYCFNEGYAQISQFINKKYTRFSVEIFGGVPFMVGNLTAFSADKTYLNTCYGVRGGYQLNRSFGIGINIAKGTNTLGARDYAADFLLGNDGNTYYLPQEFVTTTPYKDIKSNVSFMSGGIYADINLTNLVGLNSSDHGLSVLLSPNICIQQNEATVSSKTDGTQFLPSRKGMSIGLGVDAALRVRTCKWIDLQLRTGITWLSDNEFIGFNTPIQARYNYVWTTSVGIIIKIPQRGKRDNVIYVPREGDCHWPTQTYQ